MTREEQLLQECILQLEYLNEKFGETGTTNALLSKLKSPDKLKIPLDVEL